MTEYEIKEENEVTDESNTDDAVAPFRYDIESFGIDYNVESLVKRLKRGDIFMPPFQRDYVWSMTDASRFIESLLLGLPVPGIFLARETETDKLIVIDGQQRLKSLQFFYDGFFNPKPDDKKQAFKLVRVQDIFEGRAYESLNEKDRVQLDESLIYATIIKQEDLKANYKSGIYDVFERLNSGRRKIEPQEIRSTLFYGNLLNLIETLNKNVNWRKILGGHHSRLKDRELILRFLAFYYRRAEYKRPMKNFLNAFLADYRNPDRPFLSECESIFNNCIEAISQSVGDKAFRLGRSLNAAVFDSVMVGLAARLETGLQVDSTKLKNAYTELLKDSHYISLISESAALEISVSGRMGKAIDAFKFV